MYDLAQKLIQLRLATRRVCMCEGKDKNKKSTISLKTKILFLIAEECSPREIVSELMIAKTNLALITKDMANEGLIEKSKTSLDRREVSYSITPKGHDYLNERLRLIELNLPSSYSDEELQNAILIVENAIELLGGENY